MPILLTMLGLWTAALVVVAVRQARRAAVLNAQRAALLVENATLDQQRSIAMRHGDAMLLSARTIVHTFGMDIARVVEGMDERGAEAIRAEMRKVGAAIEVQRVMARQSLGLGSTGSVPR